MTTLTLLVIQLGTVGDAIDKPLGQRKAHKISKQLSSLYFWQAHNTLRMLFAKK